VLFRSESLGYAWNYFISMFGLAGQPLIGNQALYYIIEYKLEFIIAIVASMPIYPMLKSKLKNNRLLLSYIKYFVLIGLFGLCIMYLVNSTFNPFIYFRF
jgi:alginate O-acetyltransferase complex protein AlgI